MCQCEYPSSFITDAQLFCSRRNNIVFQANVHSSDEIDTVQIRSIIEEWLLTEPPITIAGQSYQVDPSCTVEVEEFGVTVCDEKQPPDNVVTAGLIAVIIAIPAILLLLILVVVLVLWRFYKHRSKSYDVQQNNDLR